MEQITKQIRVLSRERDSSLEDSAHKQLLVQDLFEDNADLQKNFEKLQRERIQLHGTLRQMMDELQASAESREELTSESDRVAVIVACLEPFYNSAKVCSCRAALRRFPDVAPRYLHLFLARFVWVR